MFSSLKNIPLCACNFPKYFYFFFFFNFKAQVITTIELLFIALYTPNMLTQLFVPCYYGSDVAKRGEELHFHMAASNWIFATSNYKRLYSMLMNKLQTTFAARVGYVIPLNLSTFLTVSILFTYIRLC